VLKQVALQRPPQYACGCLFLLSEVLVSKPPLWYSLFFYFIFVLAVLQVIIVTITTIDFFIFEISDLYAFGLGSISSLPQFIWYGFVIVVAAAVLQVSGQF
jgi:hypothetical protein